MDTHQNIIPRSCFALVVFRPVVALLPVVFLLAFILLVPPMLHAQPCPQFPATCPDLRSDPGSTDDSISRLGDPVLPCEVALENRLRQWARALMTTIAQKEKWDVTEIYEALGSGYRDDNNAVLVYERRPAHWVHFVWQFVVDKDSLQAWRDWLEDFSRRRLDQSSRSMTRINSKQSAIQAYMDSANYWGGLMATYMTDHMAQYQKDLVAGNKSGTSAYEKGVDVYRKKQDFFINKAADLQKDPQGEKDMADGDRESNARKLQFRDASIVVLELDVNDHYAPISGSIVTTPPGSPSGVKWFVNPEPDLLDNVNYFTHSHNMALWMTGDWDTKPDVNGTYRAVWAKDIRNWRILTVKKIKSDKVQNFYCRVSGNKAAIRRLLADLPYKEFESLITPQ